MHAPVTIRNYAETWLQTVAVSCKPGTMRFYVWALQHHILPAFGDRPLTSLTHPEVRAFCAQHLSKGMRPASVAGLLATLRALFSQAQLDYAYTGVTTNPCAQVGRALHLGRQIRSKGGDPKAMTKAELTQFLATVARCERDPRWALFWPLMARTGLRIGEALALQITDVDVETMSLLVRQTLAHSPTGLGSPKSHAGTRRVLVRGAVAQQLRSYLAVERPALGNASPFLFPAHGRSRYGWAPASRARESFKANLRRAGLNERFTPHSLRHTFATTLVAAGIPAAFVQQMLGHSAIGITVDLYARSAVTQDALAEQYLRHLEE